MTTELVILLSLFAFILAGVFIGDSGPHRTFQEAAPYLGARIEKHIETGAGFSRKSRELGLRAPVNWDAPRRLPQR